MGKRKKNKKRNKQKFNYFDEDSDETFAYIVGYTSGGAPYGVTWEQWEDEEEENNQSDDIRSSVDDLPF